MKKILFFLVCLALILSNANAFPIGVIKPKPVCIYPNSEGEILFQSQSMSENYELFDLYIENLSWVNLENNKVLMSPHSSKFIKARINTTEIEEGYYIGKYSFCYRPVSETSNNYILPCIGVEFYINVSNNCPAPEISTTNNKVINNSIQGAAIANLQNTNLTLITLAFFAIFFLVTISFLVFYLKK